MAVYRDAGISGSKGRDQRPGFDAMHKDAARRRFDVVMAWSVDRLGRSLQNLCGFLSELHSLSIDLFLHQQGIDTTTPAGKAMFQMMGVFAEFERAMIRERVNAGIARAKAGGKHCGRPFIDTKLEGRIRDALAAPGRPGSHKIAKQFGVGSGTVQRIEPDSTKSNPRPPQSQRGILRRGRACRRHEIAWLAGPEDPASASKPAASTGGPAVGFEEGILLRRHPRNSRSTRLRDGPAFFTARFTLAFDFPVFFAS